jgi:hypothetical protein
LNRLTLLILSSLLLIGCSDLSWSEAPLEPPANQHAEFVALSAPRYLFLPPRPAGTFYFVDNETGKLIYTIKRSAQTEPTPLTKTPASLREKLDEKKTYRIYFRPDTK